MATEKIAQEHDGLVKTYFHKASTTWDTFYDEKRGGFMRWVDRKYRSDVFNRYALTFGELGDCIGKSLLDIGCGSGPYSIEAARKGCSRVVGQDMAVGMIDLAKVRAKDFEVSDVCEFIVGAFPKDSPQEMFDHAIAMGVFDYVPDPVAFAKGMRERVTVTAMASVPTPHWFRTPLRRIRYKIKRCPIYFYTPDEIEAIFREGGFTDIKIVKMPGAGMDCFVTAG
jgi:magnesium-protoporphyrin O-methyltransferase